jgi:hypothetical protein
MAASDPNFITEGKRPMTRVSIVAALALLLFSLMLVAQPPQSPGAPQKSASSVVTITDEDNGKDIDLPAGDTLVLRLIASTKLRCFECLASTGEYSPWNAMSSHTNTR